MPPNPAPIFSIRPLQSVSLLRCELRWRIETWTENADTATAGAGSRRDAGLALNAMEQVLLTPNRSAALPTMTRNAPIQDAIAAIYPGSQALNCGR